MAKKYETECTECGRKESFTEWRDLTYAKWKVIGWSVNRNEPYAICPDCEYGKPKKKVKQ